MGGLARRLFLRAECALGGLLEARDHSERRGLAAPRGAEQGEELPALDGEIGALDGDVIPEPLDDVIDGDDIVPRLGVLALSGGS